MGGRSGQTGAGAQAKEPAKERGGGAERPAAGGPGRLPAQHARPKQTRPGGHGCVHEGGGHQGLARQASRDADPASSGDHARPGVAGGTTW